MTGFGVVPVELQVCGSMLTEISDELRTEIATLRTEMDALFSAGWRGQAANGFAQGWDEWQAGAGDVLTALHDMADLLSTAGRNYAATDQSAAGNVNDAGAGL